MTGDILYFYFHSKQRPAPNRFDWADPETDRLLELSRSSTKEDERVAAYQKLQQIVVENAICLLTPGRVHSARPPQIRALTVLPRLPHLLPRL